MRKGVKCWIALWTGVAVADIILIRNGEDALSTVFGGDLSTNPRKKWALIIAWSFLTAHLFADILPIPEGMRKYDPIGNLAKRIPVRTYEAITFAENPITEAVLTAETNPASS